MKKTNPIKTVAGCCAMMLVSPLMADTHDVAQAAEEKTLSNITEASRTVKTGPGTLILTGNNTLGNGLQVAAGTLKFNGGTTTVSCL